MRNSELTKTVTFEAGDHSLAHQSSPSLRLGACGAFIRVLYDLFYLGNVRLELVDHQIPNLTDGFPLELMVVH